MLLTPYFVVLFAEAEIESELFSFPLDFSIHPYPVLISAPGDVADPIQDSSNGLFLVSQLGCNGPKGDPFSTFTNDIFRAHRMIFSPCCRIDDRVV